LAFSRDSCSPTNEPLRWPMRNSSGDMSLSGPHSTCPISPESVTLLAPKVDSRLAGVEVCGLRPVVKYASGGVQHFRCRHHHVPNLVLIPRGQSDPNPGIPALARGFSHHDSPSEGSGSALLVVRHGHAHAWPQPTPAGTCGSLGR